MILLAFAGAGWAALVSLLPAGTIGERFEPGLVQGLVLTAVFILSMAGSRERLSMLGLQFAAWVGIAAVIGVGYAYRHDLQAVMTRVKGELLPAQGQALDGATVVFRRTSDRQFWIDALVNDQPVRFMVDTGASGIVLTRADAARLGFPRESLRFTQRFETANGVTRGAPVRLSQIRIGPLRFDDLPASVNEGDLRQSLLGMGLLERLGSLEISGDTLTLRR